MCSDKTKGVFLYRPGGKNQNSWRSCLRLKKQNQRHRKQKPFLNTHGSAVLCSSSLLSVARAKAVPIPLIFHLLALGQECTKQLRLLSSWVRGLGGRKGVRRTPTASLLHALHTQSHNPFFSPLLTYWDNLLSKPSQADISPTQFLQNLLFLRISCISDSSRRYFQTSIHEGRLFQETKIWQDLVMASTLHSHRDPG